MAVLTVIVNPPRERFEKVVGEAASRAPEIQPGPPHSLLAANNLLLLVVAELF